MAKRGIKPTGRETVARVVRTAIQVGAPALVFLVVVLPEILTIFADELGEHLPPGFRLWMLGAAATLTALSAGLSRVMLIPGVNEWITKHSNLGVDGTASEQHGTTP